MKKDIDKNHKNRKKVESGGKTAKNRASGKTKRPVTEILDFDLEEELESRKKSKVAAEAYGGRMPEKPVSLDTGTLELLEAEELIEKAGQEEAPAAEQEHTAPEEEAPVVRKKHTAPEEEAPVAHKKHAASEEEAPVVRKKHAASEEETPVVRKKHTPPEEEAPAAHKKHAAPREEEPAAARKKHAASHSASHEKARSASGQKNKKKAAEGDAVKLSAKKTAEKHGGAGRQEAAGRRKGKNASGEKRKKRGGWLADFGALDVIVALTGVIVLAVAVFTIRIYTNANTVSGQVDAMAEVGEKMETIGIAGDSVFLAVADARLAALEAAELDPDSGFTLPDGSEHYEEKELQTQVRLGLKLTSIQRDLKIKFTNKESGKLIGNQAFEVRIDGPEGMTRSDDDKDGIIYISSIKPGEYTVTVTAPAEIDGNSVAGVSGMVTVKDQIEYKKVDVTDEVKSEAEVNVAKEDTEVKTTVESALTDTVEWVESSKTPVNGEKISYEEVKKSDIPEPATVAFLDSVVSPQTETTAWFAQIAMERAAQNGAVRTAADGIPAGGVYFSRPDDEIMPISETETGQSSEFKVTEVRIQGAGEFYVGDEITLTGEASTEGNGSLEDGDFQWSGDVSGTGRTLKIPADSARSYSVQLSVKGTTASATVTVREKEPEQQVTGVSVSASSSEAKVGEEVTFNVSVSVNTGSYEGDVQWEVASGDASIVRSDRSSAAVKGNAAGDVTVRATAGGKSGEARVTFTEEAAVVTEVSISPASASASTSQPVELTVNVKMSKGDYSGTVNWSSTGGTLSAAQTTGNGSKVTLSSTASKEETYTVTAEAGGQKGTASVTFTPAEVKVTGITIQPTSATVAFGGKITLSAPVSPDNASNKAVEWVIVSGSDLISLDQSGNVTAGTKAGTAKVKARAKDGSGVESGECTITVTSGVSVTMEDPGSVKVGEEKQLKAKIEGSYDKDSVTWESKNKEIAVFTDAKNGKVKGLTVSGVTITVSVKGTDGKVVTAEGNLNVVSADAAIVLDPSSLSMKTKEKKTIKASVTTTGDKAVEWKSSDESIVRIAESKDDSCVVEALKPGKTTVVAASKANKDKTASCEITVELADGSAPLKDKNGKQLYYKDGDTYKEATAADYYKYDVFYRQKDDSQYFYTGWQDIDGKRYYFDKNGVPVTGSQIIQGMQYNFNSDGSLQVNGAMGIDISRHNGDIDWNAVKNAGVNFVILRCGYRGSSSGVLLEDQKFRANIQGATAAGLKVGIYFFSQAINEVEAVEEASLTLDLIRRYGITYPVFMDVEDANGRADRIDAGTRTKIIRAFCETVRGGGYTAGVYANKTWLNEKMNVGQLSGYKIWLAQYASKPTYGGRYDMWQYSCKGKIPGISTNVDLNMSYMSY